MGCLFEGGKGWGGGFKGGLQCLGTKKKKKKKSKISRDAPVDKRKGPK